MPLVRLANAAAEGRARPRGVGAPPRRNRARARIRAFQSARRTRAMLHSWKLHATSPSKLCVMTVVEVARVVTPENVRDVLPRFFGLSKREAKVLVASLLPVEAPPMRELVTPVRVAPPALALASAAPRRDVA